MFRLADGRHAIVKFPESQQGERVLVNELLCCSLAEELGLPVNVGRLVAIDERSLKLPRQSGKIPPEFTAGIRCGMIRFEQYEACQPTDILAQCENAAEFHSIPVYEQLVARGDGRQMLMYPAGSKKRFAVFDYGFAFGGSPVWTKESIANIAPPKLPKNDPFDNKEYADGQALAPIIGRLRSLEVGHIEEAMKEIYPPRWGAAQEEVRSLLPIVQGRARALVAQFDERYNKQIEMVKDA